MLRSPRQNSWLILLLLGAACLALPGACTSAKPPAVTAAPQRIVSLLPSFTQIVIALGGGHQVVGRTQFCPKAGIPADAEIVGAALDANYEKILALKPNLVLIQKSMSEQRQKLEALNLPVLPLPTNTIDDAYFAITQIAAKLQAETRGQQLIDRIRQGLDTVAAEARQRRPVKTLLVIGHKNGSLEGIFAAGPGSFLDQLLIIAGGVNVLTQPGSPYPQISKEEILRLDPEVIIVFAPGREASAANQDAERKLWSALSYLQAVKSERIYYFVDAYALSPGSEMVKTAHDLAGILHSSAPEPAP